MRHSLIVFFAAITVQSHGQFIDALKYNDSVGTFERKPLIDTIPAVILYSDTGRSRRPELSLVYDTIGNIVKFQRTESYGWPNMGVFWMFGYEVREGYCCDGEVYQFGYSGYYRPTLYYVHKEYLDGDKKPLRKSIIVWQSK